jgi:hypothetical protein
MQPYPARSLGELPVDLINRLLGTELEPGVARLSSTAHRHIATDHAADYAACMKALPSVIQAPSFIGQAPRHGRNFEMVKRLAMEDGRAVLVAVGLAPDSCGAYRVVSCYALTAEEVERKRAAGTLKPVLPG